MNTAQTAVIISALSLAFLILVTGLGLIVRITIRWTRIEDSLKSIAEKFGTNGDEHKALERSIDRVDGRLRDHEEWHRDHPH